MMIKVLLVDDHRLVRDALVDLLAHESDMVVVGAAADAGESIVLARVTTPDVVVMDVDLPGVGGIEATRAHRALDPSVRVVMLSATCSPELLCGAAEAGACGYLLKGGPARRLPDGIRMAAGGGHPMAPEVAALCTPHQGGLGPSSCPSATAAWRLAGLP